MFFYYYIIHPYMFSFSYTLSVHICKKIIQRIKNNFKKRFSRFFFTKKWLYIIIIVNKLIIYKFYFYKKTQVIFLIIFQRLIFLCIRTEIYTRMYIYIVCPFKKQCYYNYLDDELSQLRCKMQYKIEEPLSSKTFLFKQYFHINTK